MNMPMVRMLTGRDKETEIQALEILAEGQRLGPPVLESAARLWTSALLLRCRVACGTSWSLSFLIYKMGVLREPTS